MRKIKLLEGLLELLLYFHMARDTSTKCLDVGSLSARPGRVIAFEP
ncbi:MAG: hypothetical protein WAM73_02565 [Desulfobacterales bacterium]